MSHHKASNDNTLLCCVRCGPANTLLSLVDVESPDLAYTALVYRKALGLFSENRLKYSRVAATGTGCHLKAKPAGKNFSAIINIS